MSRKKVKSAIKSIDPIPESHEINSIDKILGIIQEHANNISRTKLQYLDEDQNGQYSIYANIEAAFDLLIDDIEQAGFKF